MYEFLPFEVQRVEYQSYSKKVRGRGINYIPKARSGHRVTGNDTDLFSFGGYNPETDEHLFPELLKFNFLTQRKVFTSQKNKMPKESVSNALTMKDDNCLVLYGGTGFPFGDKRSNDTHLMRPYGTPTIQLLETKGEKPEQLYGQAILVRDNFLYVIGGTSGHEFNCDIHRLNLITHIWKHLKRCESSQNDPAGRYRHEVAYDENYIYIFGGGTQTESFDMNVIPAYSFSENKFIFIKAKPDSSITENDGFPKARRFHSCVQHPSDDGIDVIIAGGFHQKNQYFDDIWKFNLKTHRWQLLAQTKLPYTLFFHAAASVGNGLMYIFGGVNGQEFMRTKDLHKIWVRIPKLSEICWDALIYYNPMLADRSKEDLLSIGVPRKFANRVTCGRSNPII